MKRLLLALALSFFAIFSVPSKASETPEVGASVVSVVCYSFTVGADGKAKDIKLVKSARNSRQVNAAKRELSKMEFPKADSDSAQDSPSVRKQCFQFSGDSDKPVKL